MTDQTPDRREEPIDLDDSDILPADPEPWDPSQEETLQPVETVLPYPAVSQGVENLCQSHRLAEMTPDQRLVYALLARSLVNYRSELLLVLLAAMAIPFTIGVGAVGGFLVAAGVEWLLSQVGLEDAGIYLAALMAIVVGKALQSLAKESDVSLKEMDGGIDRFKVGRLEAIFEPTESPTTGLFLGTAFGIQAALLMWSPSHFGLNIDGGFGECLLITLDNVCHGLFLDTFELYDIYWGREVEHTNFSAGVFLAFRIAFDAMALLMGYSLWQRWRMRRLFKWCPTDERDLNGILEWIDAGCGDKQCWPTRYHDEFMFMLLAGEFVRKEETFVQMLAERLPHLAIENEVRALFRAADGECLFPLLSE